MKIFKKSCSSHGCHPMPPGSVVACDSIFCMMYGPWKYEKSLFVSWSNKWPITWYSVTGINHVTSDFYVSVFFRKRKMGAPISITTSETLLLMVTIFQSICLLLLIFLMILFIIIAIIFVKTFIPKIIFVRPLVSWNLCLTFLIMSCLDLTVTLHQECLVWQEQPLKLISSARWTCCQKNRVDQYHNWLNIARR